MNGHCSFKVINLTSDDPFDYLSNGTFNQDTKWYPWPRWPIGFSQTTSQTEQIKKSLVKMTIGFLVK
jgi:hypothetical protein